MTPKAPKKTDNQPRVFRGCSWHFSDVRAAYHRDYAPSCRYYNLGFRCALRGRLQR